MVYTLTLNPSLDLNMHINELKVGEINRASGEKILTGGKGINVSCVLKELGIENKAIYFYGGFTGEQLNKKLYEAGLDTLPIDVCSGDTRINVKVLGKKETQINGKGPYITKEDVDRLYVALNELNPGDYLVISGSLPAGLEDNFYGQICAVMKKKGVNVVLDAPAKTLGFAISHNPFLIKPNKEELEEYFGRNLACLEEVKKCLIELRSEGAENICVSLGAAGAVLYTLENEFISCSSVKGEAVNSVGAGDSLVAGFLAAVIKGEDYCNALKQGVASGAATAFSEGLADFKKISQYRNIVS